MFPWCSECQERKQVTKHKVKLLQKIRARLSQAIPEVWLVGNQATPPPPPQIPRPWLVGVGNRGGKCVPGSHGAERQRGAGGRLAQWGLPQMTVP